MEKCKICDVSEHAHTLYLPKFLPDNQTLNYNIRNKTVFLYIFRVMANIIVSFVVDGFKGKKLATSRKMNTVQK